MVERLAFWELQSMEWGIYQVSQSCMIQLHLSNITESLEIHVQKIRTQVD